MGRKNATNALADSELLRILKAEVKPALGCTGPVSIAFAVAAARDAVGGSPVRAAVRMDKDSYKNSLRVGIPGTRRMGIEIAVALGAIAGDSRAGLEVFDRVTPEAESRAVAFMENVDAGILWEYEGVGLFIEARVETDKGIGTAIVAKTHTNIVYLEANGKTLVDTRDMGGGDLCDYSKDDIRRYALADLFRFARDVPLEDLSFLREGISMNCRLAAAGLADGLGGGFGKAFQAMSKGNLLFDAKAYTAAASDARMSGLALPAMSCATSGNVGITAMLPLVVISRETGATEEKLLRAIALSYLLTILMKSHIGRLSAICACSIAAGIGVAAGTSMLLGGDAAAAEAAIQNLAGCLTGVLCDGAKYGCALKLAAASGLAIDAAMLAAAECIIPDCNGLVGRGADETMAGIGRIAREGMATTAETLARLIIEREKKQTARS